MEATVAPVPTAGRIRHTVDSNDFASQFANTYIHHDRSTFGRGFPIILLNSSLEHPRSRLDLYILKRHRM